MQLHKAIGALQFWKPRSLGFWLDAFWTGDHEAKWPKYLSGCVLRCYIGNEYTSIVYSTMVWTKRWWLCYFSDRLGYETMISWRASWRATEMGMTQSPEQRWPSFMQGIVMCTSKSVPIPFMLFQMRILRIPQNHSPYVYIYIHPLSPDWFWHSLAASNDLPSHNSDTRLSQSEFLHRNSNETFPKP